MELDGDITEEEIDIAVRKLNATGPGMTGAHATAIKALWSEEFSSGGESETARKLLIGCVQSVWKEEEVPAHWVEALLKILPKPGDQSDPSNCRGIQMLEVSYKIIGNVMRERSRAISEKLEQEAQRRKIPRVPPRMVLLCRW